MMLRKDSSRKPGWRAIAVVPAVAVSALVLNVDVVADTTNSLSDIKVTNYISSVQEQPSSELQLVAHVPAPAETSHSDEEVLSSAEEMPRFPGGEGELMKCIAHNIHYPKEAMEQNIQGRVIVRFVVTRTGKIGQVEIVRGNDLLNQSAIDAVKALPDFIPGKVNGNPVSVWYVLPITFRLSEDDKTDTDKSAPSETIDPSRGTIAQFPGGEIKLMEYLAKNIIYPKEAMEQNVEGRVVTQFTIGKTGKVGDIKVVRSVSPELDREAIRVVSTLPDFIPAKLDGNPVASWYTLPISFKLSGSKDESQTKNETTFVLRSDSDRKPLAIVDGTPRNINDIKPDDIESITVLKDDKAKQMYGDAGANGVILITTNKQNQAK